MKPREFKINFALSDWLNIMRLNGYIRRYINPKYMPRTRFQRQHIRPTRRQLLINAAALCRRRTGAH